MKNNLITLIAFLLTLGLNLSASESVDKVRLEKEWLFVRGDLGSVWEAVRPAPSEKVPVWDKVTLPHCFNAFDAVSPDVNYYQGVGWYKTILYVHNPYAGGRTILEFEGAGQKTDVYIFMTKVASHVGGYDRWRVDITDALAKFAALQPQKRFAGGVPLSIRCDNSRDTEMVPSDLSDFNLYGGIYRPLNLVYVPAISLNNMEIDARVDAKTGVASMKIKAGLYAPVKGSSKVILSAVVTDPKGEVISKVSKEMSSAEPEMLLIDGVVKKPVLWSTDSPELYTCQVTLACGDQKMSLSKRFGFRFFEFKDHGPFLLNGERLLLRGTHRHEDHAGVGAALTDEIMRREMQMIKDMGVNFIRLGHYQQADLVLDLCDSLGILVWEEIPWCRGGLGGEKYQKQAEDMLVNMISQHRHHPGIIMWGMGNENDWPNDFPEFDKAKIRAFMSKLHNLSHKLDDSRLTCIRRCDFCSDIVDVYSPSLWAGWYGGKYTDYKNAAHYYMKRTKKMMHVEWGGDSHAGRFCENPYAMIDSVDVNVPFNPDYMGAKTPFTNTVSAAGKGDWSESYICDLFDWTLKEQFSMPWIAGAANWTFKDFSTPLRPGNPIPYVNQKGVVTRDLTPKESYYVFQSYWAKEPMVHIFGHGWMVRWGEKDEPKLLKVYSNCASVELFLNGVSLGVKNRKVGEFPAAGLWWKSALKEGENQLEAVAKIGKGKNARTITDKLCFEYQSAVWEKEAVIEAKVVERTDCYAWVEMLFKDKNGVRCLDSRKLIEFGYTGDGEMIYDLGTPTASRVVQAFNGRGRIKVELTRAQHGVVSVKSKGIPTQFVHL